MVKTQVLFFPFKLLSLTAFIPVVIFLLMLYSSSCNLVWSEAASQPEVWSVVFIPTLSHFLKYFTVPYGVLSESTTFSKQKKKRFQRFHVKAPPQLWELCMWLLLWWIHEGGAVTSLNWFSDNSQNLSGVSKCRRLSSFLQSLACFCSLTADSLKSEASPLKGLKFYLFILWSIKLLLNLTSG